jgi:hypothetical protein
MEIEKQIGEALRCRGLKPMTGECKRGHPKSRYSKKYPRTGRPGKFVTICLECNRFRGRKVRSLERLGLKKARALK